MAIELPDLRHAVIAADKASFLRAAAVLNIKQSTLSRAERDWIADPPPRTVRGSSAGMSVRHCRFVTLAPAPSMPSRSGQQRRSERRKVTCVKWRAWRCPTEGLRSG
jgi:hypothetical protein